MTTKRPWTSGDWRVLVSDYDDFDDGTYVIMDTRIKNPGNFRCAHEWKCESVNEPEALANARLMAAAPQLYEALEVASDAIEHFVPIVGEVDRHTLNENELVALDAMLHIMSALRAANPSAFESEVE